MQQRVHDLTDETFGAEVLAAPALVLVGCLADWCGPSRTVAPLLAGLARTHGDRLKVARLDVEAHDGIFGHYGLDALPTLLFFYRGQVIGELVGARPEAEIDAEVRRLLAAVADGSYGTV